MLTVSADESSLRMAFCRGGEFAAKVLIENEVKSINRLTIVFVIGRPFFEIEVKDNKLFC